MLAGPGRSVGRGCLAGGASPASPRPTARSASAAARAAAPRGPTAPGAGRVGVPRTRRLAPLTRRGEDAGSGGGGGDDDFVDPNLSPPPPAPRAPRLTAAEAAVLAELEKLSDAELEAYIDSREAAPPSPAPAAHRPSAGDADLWASTAPRPAAVAARAAPASPDGPIEYASLDLALSLARAADKVKAVDVSVLKVEHVCDWTRYFVIATAFSRPQLDAIAREARDVARGTYGLVVGKQSEQSNWLLLDYGDVVLHVFTPATRAYYRLEELYDGMTAVPLPFETERPPRPLA